MRSLEAADGGAYRELRLEMLAESPSAFGSDLAAARSLPPEHFVERARNQRENFIVGAFSGTTLVGTCGAYRETDIKRRHIAAVWGMYVSPSHRGAGLARRLLTEALGRLRDLDGVEQVQLAVTAGNEAAEGLYRSLGFEAYGCEPAALKVDGTDYDEVLMSLPLR